MSVDQLREVCHYTLVLFTELMHNPSAAAVLARQKPTGPPNSPSKPLGSYTERGALSQYFPRRFGWEWLAGSTRQRRH